MTRSEIIEILVLLTLWVEFWYDAWWNTRENRRKRMKKVTKHTEFESLNLGEGK